MAQAEQDPAHAEGAQPQLHITQPFPPLERGAFGRQFLYAPGVSARGAAEGTVSLAKVGPSICHVYCVRWWKECRLAGNPVRSAKKHIPGGLCIPLKPHGTPRQAEVRIEWGTNIF